jgi:hypothetical protein
MKKNYSRIFAVIILLILTFSSLLSYGQSKNSYQFIEPNLSMAFDSNVFKITNSYSNGTYNTASNDFKKLDDTIYRVKINVSADHSTLKPSRDLQDNLLEKRKEELKKLQNDTVNIESMIDRTINGFSCMGVVAINKINNKYATLIKALKLFDGGYCEISYVSFGRNDLQKEYKILNSFLSGFMSYSPKQISEEDKLIKNKYTVEVDTSNTPPDDYRKNPITYSGVVKVKQNLEHKVAEVRLSFNGGYEIFFPAENGTVPIVATDADKGATTRRGEFVIFNSFGKKVYLPFTFSYISSGKR